MTFRFLSTFLGILLLVLLLPAAAKSQSSSPEVPDLQLGSAFTYQGYLKSPDGSPVSGACDFQFSLFDDPSAGSQIGSTLSLNNVILVSGRFTVQLDFGSLFTGEARWLQIALRYPAGSGGYITLTPRQPLTAAPYALALPGLRTVPDPTSPNIIGGYLGNGVSAVGAVIGGGGSLGFPNFVYSDYGTVAGGAGNVAGDSLNPSSGDTVGGGLSNLAKGGASTVVGGQGNIASGLYSTVVGGQENTASWQYSTVLGGKFNVSSGFASVAAGYRAKANHPGTFVWADDYNVDFASTGDRQFFVRASGGVYFYASPNGDNGGHCILPANGTGWSCSSDRNIKENFAKVDPQTVLQQLEKLPITRWNIRGQDPSIQHFGPVAQDFYAAFHLGDDERLISTTDAQGVALAGIQGLVRLNREQQVQIDALQEQISLLERHQEELGKRISELEAAVARQSDADPAATSASAWLTAALLGCAATLIWTIRRSKGGSK